MMQETYGSISGMVGVKSPIEREPRNLLRMLRACTHYFRSTGFPSQHQTR